MSRRPPASGTARRTTMAGCATDKSSKRRQVFPKAQVAALRKPLREALQTFSPGWALRSRGREERRRAKSMRQTRRTSSRDVAKRSLVSRSRSRNGMRLAAAALGGASVTTRWTRKE